jgi:hypothetical protein
MRRCCLRFCLPFRKTRIFVLGKCVHFDRRSSPFKTFLCSKFEPSIMNCTFSIPSDLRAKGQEKHHLAEEIKLSKYISAQITQIMADQNKATRNQHYHFPESAAGRRFQLSHNPIITVRIVGRPLRLFHRFSRRYNCRAEFPYYIPFRRLVCLPGDRSR